MGGQRSIGRWGEGIAAEFLMRHGFRIITRNYHTPVGELDLIAKRGSDWYGVEVKTRDWAIMSNDDAITMEKKRRLFKTLKKYCWEFQIDSESVYLAGIIIGINRVEKKLAIRWALIY